MVYKINPAKCISCHTCMNVCPVMAISITSDGKCAIDATKCMSCGTCAQACPVGAIAPDVH